MAVLLVGLILFLGMHSVRVVADGWRSRVVARIGAQPWKGLYSAVSGVGLGLVIWGFSLAREDGSVLWAPVPGATHWTASLTLLAFVLLTATYVPGNRIRGAVGNPMVLSVVFWSAGHLLANGRSQDLALFGGFLVWGLLDFIAATRRDRAAGKTMVEGSLVRDSLVIVIGFASWALFALVLHAWLFGVSPLG